MTSRRFFALVVLSLVAMQPLLAADLAAEADRIAKFYHEQYQFNGTVLVSKSGKIAFKGAYGLADREWNIPNTTDTRFRIGSITKQFSATLILQLVEEGKLALDAPLSRYLPKYPSKVADRVTIHQLLTHTSGIRSYTSMPNFRGEVSRDPYKPLEFLKVFADEPLDFEPGEKFQYNNSGYFLLGVIIETVTGKTYEDVLQERIFEPLGMKASGYDHADALIQKRATGYDARLGGYRNSPYLDMSLPYAAGSLYSTVEDLYVWDRALAAGKVLSEEMRSNMFQPQVKVAPPPDAPSYGYGWFLRDVDKAGASGEEIRLIEHSGGINGFNTLIQRIPEDDHLIVLLNNSPGANLGAFAEAIRPLLYEEPAGELKKSSAVAVYSVYREEGAEPAAARWKEVRGSDEYLDNPPEQSRLIRAVADANAEDARTLLQSSDLPEKPPTAGLWMVVGDAFAAKGLRNDAAQAYGTALTLGPGLANALANKLKDLPASPR